MVLESIINPFKAEKQPWELFFIGMIYSSAAMLLALWVFRPYSSLVMVFLTTLAAVPLIYATMKVEEEKDESIISQRGLFKEHSKAITFLMLYFLGMSLSFTAWYFLSPQSLNQELFKVQTQTILEINNRVTGNMYGDFSVFGKIFFNNLKVLVFCILFSFLYGVGAIFILTWNASILGTAMGDFMRGQIANSAGYFSAVGLGMFRYLFHGLPEILAYFIAGLAGGIISVAIINHNFSKENFAKVLTDASYLIAASVLILVFAALLEVYVTPIFF